MQDHLRCQAFTLVELLMVMTIVAIVSAMALSVPQRTDSEAYVRASAYELAGVLRDTRERAIKQRCMYAVSFNICNEPGSSGVILNNRGGGHWYRVIGPDTSRQMSASADPWALADIPLMYRSNIGLMEIPIRPHLETVQRSWAGDKITLPKGKVRFLSLTDQDNANFRVSGDTYAPTYPRPWFGWYDTIEKRLHPWGGYDPTLPMTTQTGDTSYPARTKSGRVLSHSGFFYEGSDGIISGSKHPTTRLVVDDTNNDGIIALPGSTAGRPDDLTNRYQLWKEGDQRPLIDGDWLDCLIIFKPDGTTTTNWMRLRHEYTVFRKSTGVRFLDQSQTSDDAVPPAGFYRLDELGIGDRCNRRATGINPSWGSLHDSYLVTCTKYPEASSWTAYTGAYYITLAPDSKQDDNHFDSAQAALRSITPCYRVAISVFGDVRVIKVRNSDKMGRVLDTTISGTAWQNKTTTNTYYRLHGMTDATGARKGTPTTDIITTDMMSQRIWWWQ